MNLSDGMACQACGYHVTSEEHMDKCNTVSKYGIMEFEVGEGGAEFKPIMTYGLWNCTALLMVFFRPSNNEEDIPFKVILGHRPSAEQVAAWFRFFASTHDRIATVILTPQKFVKSQTPGSTTVLWETRPQEEEVWNKLLGEKKGQAIRLEFFSPRQANFPMWPFQCSIYFRMKPGPQYSSIHGGYLPLHLNKTG
jgi:hypothetical protein